MAKTVTFHNPDMEDGIIFDVGGLAIPNGGSIELSDEQELEFFAKKQTTLDEFFKGDKLVKVSGKSSLSNEDKKAHTPSLDDDEETEE